MAQSLDELVEFLLDEIALEGARGASLQDVIRYTKRFYASPHYASTPTHLDSSLEHTQAASVCIDKLFVDQIWSWLTYHHDLSIGNNDQYRDFTLEQLAAHFPTLLTELPDNHGLIDPVPEDVNQSHHSSRSDAPIQHDEAASPRIVACHDLIYHAVCGHSPDANRISEFEYALLCAIGAARRDGILQGELTRFTGQDKRTVPKRTDDLQKKGYIVKQIAYNKGQKTSRLFLRRFAPSQDASTSVGSLLHLKDVARQIFVVLSDNPCATQDYLASVLSIVDLMERRVLDQVIQHFLSMGCLETVQAPTSAGSTSKDHEVRLQVKRSPTDGDLEKQEGGLVDLEITLQYATALLKRGIKDLSATIPGTTDQHNLERTIPTGVSHHLSWNPDRILPNVVSDLATLSGSEGMTITTTRQQLLGSGIINSVESLLSQLSGSRLDLQSVAVRRPALVKTTELKNGIAQNVYRSPEIYQSMNPETEPTDSDAQRPSGLVWRTGSTSNGNTADDVERDHFGFVRRTKPEGHIDSGRATLEDIAGLPGSFTGMAVRSSEPILEIEPSVTTTLPETPTDLDTATSSQRTSTPKSRGDTVIRQTESRSKKTQRLKAKKQEAPQTIGRPRKFVQGTEKFWRTIFEIKKAEIDPDYNRNQKKGLTKDPDCLKMFASRPVSFDETLIRALDQDLPVPDAPAGIDDTWIDKMNSFFDRSTTGLFYAPSAHTFRYPGCSHVRQSHSTNNIDSTGMSTTVLGELGPKTKSSVGINNYNLVPSNQQSHLKVGSIPTIPKARLTRTGKGTQTEALSTSVPAPDEAPPHMQQPQGSGENLDVEFHGRARRTRRPTEKALGFPTTSVRSSQNSSLSHHLTSRDVQTEATPGSDSTTTSSLANFSGATIINTTPADLAANQVVGNTEAVSRKQRTSDIMQSNAPPHRIESNGKLPSSLSTTLSSAKNFDEQYDRTEGDQARIMSSGSRRALQEQAPGLASPFITTRLVEESRTNDTTKGLERHPEGATDAEITESVRQDVSQYSEPRGPQTSQSSATPTPGSVLPKFLIGRDAAPYYRKFLMELVHMCGGVVPHDASMLKRAMNSKSVEAHVEPNMNVKLIKSSINILTQRGNLKTMRFAYQRNGFNHTKAILALPNILSDDPLLLAMQSKISLLPADVDYIPPELEREAKRKSQGILRNHDSPDPEKHADTGSAVSTKTKVQDKHIGPRKRRDRSISEWRTSYSPVPPEASLNTGFLTLKVPNIARIRTNNAFTSNYFGLPTQPLLMDSDNETEDSEITAPQSSTQRIRAPKPRQSGSVAHTRRVQWRAPKRTPVPKSLRAILTNNRTANNIDHNLSINPALETFDRDVDFVCSWEQKNFDDLQEQKSGEWSFINHFSSKKEFVSVKRTGELQFCLVTFNNLQEQYETDLPEAESWKVFADVMAKESSKSNKVAYGNGKRKRKPQDEFIDGRSEDEENSSDDFFSEAEAPQRKRQKGVNRKWRRKPRIAGTDKDKRRQRRSYVTPRGIGLRDIPKNLAHRITTAIVVVRVLTGGLEKYLDWKLVARLIPEEPETMLQSRWRTLSTRYNNDFDAMVQDLQGKYLDALADDKVPSVNYDDLLKTNWEGIFEWAVANINADGKDAPSIEIPPNRDEFLELNKAEVAEPTSVRHLHNSSLQYTQATKEDVWCSVMFGTSARSVPAAAPQHIEPTFATEDEEADVVLARARSWVFAAILTPNDSFDPHSAHAKLRRLAEGKEECERLIETTLKRLQNDKLVVTKDSADAMIDSSGSTLSGTYDWKLSTKFSDRFELNRFVNSTMLKQAVRYKIAVLDPAFACGQLVTIPGDPHLEDGVMVAIFNLMNMGMLLLETDADIPATRYGIDAETEGYKTRSMDKKSLFFSTVLRPTSKYTHGDLSLSLKSSASIPRGDMDQEDGLGLIPMWFDINHDFRQHIWEMTVGAITGLISCRPGVSTMELVRTLGYAVSQRDVKMIVDYLLKCEMIEETCLGWETTETWWFAVGLGNMATPNGTD